jgi:flagellar FliL protein
MKIVIFIVAAVLLVGAGAGGSYFFLKNPANASVPPATEAQQAEAEKNKEAAAASKEHMEHTYVQLDPLILPVVDQNGVDQVVSMVVVLEVKDDAAKGIVTKLQPRLKDAYIQQLYGVLNRHAAMQNGVLQVSMIKEKLTSITNKVLGDDVVADVLLDVVQQRPI